MKNGFSLIELLVVMAIGLILLGMGYPSYQYHLRAVNRRQAEVYLLRIVGYLEDYQIAQGTYEGAKLEELTACACHQYQFSLVDLSQTHYRVEAMPVGQQIKDACGVLSIDSEGQQTASDKKNCW